MLHVIRCRVYNNDFFQIILMHLSYHSRYISIFPCPRRVRIDDVTKAAVRSLTADLRVPKDPYVRADVWWGICGIITISSGRVGLNYTLTPSITSTCCLIRNISVIYSKYKPHRRCKYLFLINSLVKHILSMNSLPREIHKSQLCILLAKFHAHIKVLLKLVYSWPWWRYPKPKY